MNSADPAVLVANLSAPEINRLGAELASRGVLQRYVRPYLNRGRGWERLLARWPGIGPLYGRTLGRRMAPPGLPAECVTEAGVVQDFAAAVVNRMPLVAARWRKRTAHGLIFAAERAVATAAGRLADADEIDIVVASYGTGKYAFEAVQRRGGTAVLSYPIAHNRYQAALYAEEAAVAPEFAAALPTLDQLPPDYSARLERECEIADRILVGSSFVQQSFVALGYDAAKIRITPYGVDSSRFSPTGDKPADGIFRALFVGQIGQRKGMSYLLEGYRQFRRDNTELHLVGSYVPGSEVYGRFANLYRHTPNIPQKDLPALYRQADVFVFPSLIEGMPLVVLEAMACGVPVITTRHGPGDILRDGIDGFFVPIRDPEAIALRLEQLHKDPALRAQMGRNAREQALKFTWGAYARCAADAVLESATGR